MSDLRFLLDENIPKSVMNFLKSKKILVEYVPKGIKNSRVAEITKNFLYFILGFKPFQCGVGHFC